MGSRNSNVRQRCSLATILEYASLRAFARFPSVFRVHGVERFGNVMFLVLPCLQVERVKRVLSSQHQARLEIESLVDGLDFSETLTRARFEEVRKKSKSILLHD